MGEFEIARPRSSMIPLGEKIFEALAREIIANELIPGQRISDLRVAQKFQVSRMPVREALRRLEQIGLVEVFASRGTFVTTVTNEVIRTTLEFAGYQAGIATHASVPLLNTSERSAAAHLAEEAARVAEHHTDASKSRHRLFVFLAERSGNAMHQAHIRDLEYAFERNLGEMGLLPGLPPLLKMNFHALAQAILANDRSTAERTARALYGVEES